MRVISKAALIHFRTLHPPAQRGLQEWFTDASAAQWQTPQDIKARYASASFLGGKPVVFNIKGNDYPLVMAVAYRFAAVYIKFVGTHAQYDAINASLVETSS